MTNIIIPHDVLNTSIHYIYMLVPNCDKCIELFIEEFLVYYIYLNMNTIDKIVKRLNLD